MPTFSDVNKQILKTLIEEPSRFLAKNNGLTFRASSVRTDSSNNKVLSVTDASIVNGLQTTMAVIEQPSEECYLLVKVVEAKHSWEIAKAANLQNRIAKIDLDLAEYLRPREVRSAAAQAGLKFEYDTGSEEESVFAVLESIYQQRVSYREVRSLFIGLFSRNPNNTIDPDYDQLRSELIDALYEDDPNREKTFGMLFDLQRLTLQAAKTAQNVFRGQYANVFQRFWSDQRPRYRALLTILAICGCVRENIYDDPSTLDGAKMRTFFDAIHKIIDRNSEVFIRYFRHAFKAVAFEAVGPNYDRSSAIQDLFTTMHRANFNGLYAKMCIDADDDDVLRNMSTEIDDL